MGKLWYYLLKLSIHASYISFISQLDIHPPKGMPISSKDRYKVFIEGLLVRAKAGITPVQLDKYIVYVHQYSSTPTM